jgi:diamine N-acetyltransferase
MCFYGYAGMTILKGEHIYLRALEPEDLEYLYMLENDPTVWEISGTITPYSRKVLRDYLNKAHQDIYEAKQVRLVICRTENQPIGLIDLFDFDPRHQRAGVGILISREGDRGQGFGSEALRLLCDYAFGILNLHQVYASISADNARSRNVFEKLGFQVSGLKKDWLQTASGFQDVLLMQKIRKNVH